MTVAKDGGPAFPGLREGHANRDRLVPVHGMSLRDYFAAKAMAALIGNTKAFGDEETYKSYPARAADRAYGIADAMLASRSKP